MTAALCLKARPTPTQLADRLRPIDGVWPDGLELFLTAADLNDVEAVANRVETAEVPHDFAWLIEGPVDSLDGADFDITRESEADVEVVRRLAELAARINARAVNIHCIAPSSDTRRLTLEHRAALLERATPFVARFAEDIQKAGAVPTIEHMPPVLRMRRADFAFSPIGMASEDLLWLCNRIDGLKVLCDTSHAGLYLNARAVREDERFEPLLRFIHQLPPEAHDVLGYVQAFATKLENAQISNAQGLLGEGLPYAHGDLNLDEVLPWLGEHVRYIVTETLEPDNEDAVFMRDALRQMRVAVG